MRGAGFLLALILLPAPAASGQGTVETRGRATAAAPTYLEGGYNFYSLDLNGNLRVRVEMWPVTPGHIICDSGCGGAASFSDSAAFTAGSTAINIGGGVYDDLLAALTTGTAAAPRLTARRAFHVNLRDAAGAELGLLGAPLRIDPTGTTTQPVSAANLDVALSTRLKPADTLAGVTAVGSITNALPTGSNTIGKVDQGAGGASAWKVDGSAVTQPVSGSVTANAGTNLNTSALLQDATFTGRINTQGQKAMSASTPVAIASDQSAIPTTAPTLTKGTQGATGYSTQDLKDAGRTAISFYANGVAAGTTGTETLITLTQSKGTAATSSAASYTITSGKTLRIEAIQVASRGNATATAQITTFNLRLNTAGACVVGSTPILAGIATATPATSSTWDRAIIPLGDGYEIAGNGTIALCLSANAVYVTNAPTWFVNLIGFEY